MTMKAYVYRHFDKEGKLLYVGLSNSHLARLASHKRSAWFQKIKTVTVDGFETRKDAGIAEQVAIKSEKPIYNQRHMKAVEPTKQTNVELPAGLARLIKSDAIEMGVTLNEYATRAFRAFLAKNRGQRRVHFDGVKRKVLGRKLKVQP